MQIKTIDQLPEAVELNDGDRIIVNQADTSKVNLGKVKDYMQKEVMDYIDNSLSGRNEWLAPVNKVSELKTDLDKEINYLCKVVADPDKSGVYQCIAGWEEEPVWTLFDDAVDFVSEEELEAGIDKHDTSDIAHNDIRQLITLEEQARDQQVTNAVNIEAQARQAADRGLQEQIDGEIQARKQGDANTLNAAKSYADGKAADISSILDGAQALTLEGALLTRVINGTTPVARNLFDPQTVFVEGKTLISDKNGTIGAVREINNSTITAETLSVSPMSAFEPTLLGNVNDFASLPQTVQEAVMLGWNTPRIDDYARVLRDETNDDRTVEWYIEGIDDGEITWANPVIINTGDYQGQTTTADTGKVLTGGATAGTFGTSLSVDTAPTENSNNLLSSGAVFDENFLTMIENRLFDKEHPVGDVVVQYPGTKSPIEKNWRGEWVDWTNRASAYRLRTSALPNNTIYAQGANYAANEVVMWHLNGDDWGYYKAIAAITNAAEQLDPVKWEQLKTGTLVWRDELQDVNPWTNNDLTIGQQITVDGTVYWVEEIAVYGGKFFSAAGGNRPPFESGVADDVQRDHQHNYDRPYYSPLTLSWGSNALYYTNGINNVTSSGAQNTPLGPENAPRTVSARYWRRVA